MSYFLEAIAMPTWVWWLLVGHVVLLVLCVVFTVGFMTGFDHARRLWKDGVNANARQR